MSDAALSDAPTAAPLPAAAAPAPLAPRVFARRPAVRQKAPPGDAVAQVLAVLSLAGKGRRSRKARRMGDAAARRAADLGAASRDMVAKALAAARPALRLPKRRAATVIEALALAGDAARRTLGVAPFPQQYACAAALFEGAVVEMDTGEGKTIAAFLGAAAYGLAGRAVHVVTSNDYLADRDARDLMPAFQALGLSVGIVTGKVPAPERRVAYDADVVYISSKEAAFDYLRDRLARRPDAADPNLVAKLGRLFDAQAMDETQPLQRALDVAIVDEVDSVLIDEAGTPLLISSSTKGEISADDARFGLALAQRLAPGADFVVPAGALMPTLTPLGAEKIEFETEGLRGPWRVRLIREELARAAIAAVHVVERDGHYLVRDGKIVLIDQQSGRPTPDRHWSNGLDLMVEIKEGCAPTGRKKSLASISFQRFFRGYARLAGLSGTVKEVSRELHAVYGLPMARVARRLPSMRCVARRRVFRDREALWRAVAQTVADLRERGQPVLVAVRSVAEADRASAALDAQSVPHRVLSAAQDKAEADVVARAGAAGAVTVVTNMAGRGTDIRLGPGVAARGGLAVIVCERHESRRVDRQLMGRCARQGDPGLVMEFISTQDAVLRILDPVWRRAAQRWPALCGLLVARAQRLTEARDRRGRIQLMRRDEQLAKVMAFAGGLD